MPKVFNFGRLFFPGDIKAPIPNEVRFQPLGNHVGNVMELVKCWQKEDFPSSDSLNRVLEAAKIHDMGKPKHFAIQSENASDGTFKKYIYSFKGHRFDAKSSNLWAQTLAIGHHDFSVGDITRDTYNLKKYPQYASILDRDPLTYARELYILEMCDQIEAELACRVLGDDDQAESRAFMEFTIAKQINDETIYLIDPWPFSKSSISMTFRYWSMKPIEIDDDKELQKCVDSKDPQQKFNLGKILDRLAKNWWKNLEEKPQESEPKTISLQPYQSENTSQSWTPNTLYQQIASFQPNSMQVEVFNAIYDSDKANPPAILLKALTGVGKTEAVLLPAIASNYRLILPLPTRSLLDDQKERVEKYLKGFSKINPDREFSLVVDTGSEMYRWIYKNGEEVKAKRTSNPRRHLYKGDVILTTLDKFLYRYFAFGDKQKSFIFPHRIHGENTLICFDEAHSYDDISFTNFQSLVRSLYEAGRSLVLMTATLPPQMAEYFNYLQVIDYTHELSKLPQRSLQWYSDISCYEENTKDEKDFVNFQKQFIQIISREWQAKPNCRILAVVETVRDAVAIYQQLKEQFGCNQNTTDHFLFLYHGRIADQLRPDIYKKIKQRDSHEQSYILITTSAIEVGCDLNSEVLISQICPPENLIQRTGRCNRRNNVPNAKVIVVGDRIPDFANSLNEEDWQKYQQVLSNLKHFDTRAIAECISNTQNIDDYRVVEVFSMLHDYVYGADLTCQPTHERGLIPTRSWEPSITLKFEGKDKNTKLEVKHSISVPIEHFCSGQEYAYICVNERCYEKETTQWNENHPLSWGSAYSKDIIVHISNNLCDFIFDTLFPEYSYDSDLGFVDLPKVFIKLKTNGIDQKLLYQHNKRGKKESTIIWYTNNLRE